MAGVKLVVEIGPAGKVSSVVVVESEPDGFFDLVATEAVSTWEFESSDMQCWQYERIFFEPER